MTGWCNEAVAALDDALDPSSGRYDSERGILALIGVGRAVLALVETLDGLGKGGETDHVCSPCGHTLGTQCPGCDHATHRGSACLARVIAASGGEEMCRCRFGEEATRAAAVFVTPRPLPTECAICGEPFVRGARLSSTEGRMHHARCGWIPSLDAAERTE